MIGGVSSEALKRVFSRERPDTTSNPNEWFKGGGNQSFPSGEVTTTSAVVTLLVLSVMPHGIYVGLKKSW